MSNEGKAGGHHVDITHRDVAQCEGGEEVKFASISIAINVAMLVIVQNLLEWGWLPFLTDEFADVVPWISLSLVASIVANIIYQIDDSLIVESMQVKIADNMISVWATYTVLTIFPFDFSGYAFDWEVVARVALIFAIVGAGIAALVEAIKLVSAIWGPSGCTGSSRKSFLCLPRLARLLPGITVMVHVGYRRPVSTRSLAVMLEIW